MTSAIRWISADLQLLPENGNRYEIIDGELFVTRAPHWFHQRVCGNLYMALTLWGIGYAAIGTGIVWGESDDVIPDVVWLGSENYERLLDESGHLLGSPDLVVEVLSPGITNERRDKEVKLKLYAARGVKEYWIVGWQGRQVSIYRQESGQLKLITTLSEHDVITSPLLPNFVCPVKQIFL